MLTTLLKPRQPQRGAKTGSASRPAVRVKAPFDVGGGAGFQGRGVRGQMYTGFDGGTVDNQQAVGVPFNRRWPSQETVVTRQTAQPGGRWTPPPAPAPIRSMGFMLALQVAPGRPAPKPTPPQRQYDTYYVPLVVGPPPLFPAQYAGLRTFYGGAVKELCLVAEADAPTGMGGVVKVNKNGTLYAVYLVETNDANASSVRITTSAGTKSIRLKT